MRAVVRSVIHRATVSAADASLDEGVVIDPYVMNAAAIAEYERVEVIGAASGNRFSSFIIGGRKGSGDVRVHGSGAHFVLKGEKIIIIAYAFPHEGQLIDHKPKLVYVDEDNQVITLREGV